MPRVSVLLTCYNHARFLPEAVRSLQAQTFRDFEVIAIDDGSTDGERQMLSEFAEDLDWFKVLLNEQNVGTYGSLNRALAEASGELIAIFNDDDLWASTKLEAQVKLMDAEPAVGLCYTDGQFIDAQGAPMAGEPLGFGFPREGLKEPLLDLVYANKIIASSVLVRRSCFDAVGHFDEAYFGSGDWEMWLRIAERFGFGFVPLKLTMYRVHGENASHQLERIWTDDERLRLWLRERWPLLEERVADSATLRRAASHNEACLGTVFMLNGKQGQARSAYARSLKLRPTRIKSVLRLFATFLPPAIFRRLL